MSDLSIPGVTRKIDTKAMVDAIMEADRGRLKRKQEELEQVRGQKSVWQDVRQRLSQVETSARSLYSFQNPFREKNAASGDPSVLTATATREAGLESHKLRVVQTARADRFLSDPLPRDFRAPAGSYRFRVGDEEVRLNFRGGSIGELVEAINRSAGRLVEARLIKANESSQVLLIEAKKTGAANALSLLDAAAELGLATGMLAPTGRRLATPPLAPESLSAPADPERVLFRDGALTLKPGGEATLPLPGGQPITPEVELEVRLRVSALPEEPWKTPLPPSGPRLTSPGEAEFEGHKVQDETSQFLMPPWKAPEPPPRIDDFNVIAAVAGGRPLELPPIQAREGAQTWRAAIGALAGSLDALSFRNRNTHRQILIEEVRLVDPTVRGDHKPKNAVSEARDAVLEIDGIRVTRGSNQIDDLLTGVSLTLHAESDKPVNLEVKTNVETVKNSIIEFVGFYNQLLGQIDVLTRSDEQVIADLTYLDDEGRRKAREQLGMLQGDLALNQMKGRMRESVAAPYPTSLGRDLAMLVQIGIGTDTARPAGSGAVDKSRLRGYLEIDEAKLSRALEERIDAVRELFGNDTDGDFVVDSGVAFAVAESARPYIQQGGMIGTRVATIDQTVSRRERDIATLTRQLEEKEARLQREYTMMEGALNTLERSSRTLDNFTKGTAGAGQR